MNGGRCPNQVPKSRAPSGQLADTHGDVNGER